MTLAKKGTWNILEYKLLVHLVEDGYVDFTYRKISKIEDSIRNGRFRFDVGFYNRLHDDDPLGKGQSTHVLLKKGTNELMWYYAFSTSLDYTDLHAEISVIDFAYSLENCHQPSHICGDSMSSLPNEL